MLIANMAKVTLNEMWIDLLPLCVVLQIISQRLPDRDFLFHIGLPLFRLDELMQCISRMPQIAT